MAGGFDSLALLHGLAADSADLVAGVAVLGAACSLVIFKLGLVAESRNGFLLYDDLIAGRAVLALCKSGRGAGRLYRRIGNDGVAVYGNDRFVIRRVGSEYDSAALGRPCKKLGAVVVICLRKAAAVFGKSLVDRLVCSRRFIFGCVVGQKFCKVCTLELGCGLAGYALNKRVDGHDADGLVFLDIALLYDGLGVVIAVVINIDACAASVESACIGC